VEIRAPGDFAATTDESPEFMPRYPKYARCPECGANDADRVTFTWWGGIIGPAILTHVECATCGTLYNGRTGKSNNQAIAVYFVVGILLGVLGMALGVLWIIRQNGL